MDGPHRYVQIFVRVGHYGNTGCGDSREGYKIRKVFWLKINCSQMKLPNLENGVVAS